MIALRFRTTFEGSRDAFPRAGASGFWRERNILLQFCFILGGALGMAAALSAAPPEPAGVGAIRITSVVRSDPRTGKLVRSVVVTPKTVGGRRVQGNPAAPRAAAPGIDAAVERIAAEHAVPARLVHSVIQAESNYDPAAVSPKGALGLMQLIPATARRFGVSNVFDPLENIQGGVKYLRYLLDLYSGDYPLTLAAYNAGEGAVARYGGVPPYPETRNYLERAARRLSEAPPAAAPGGAPAPAEPAKEAIPTGPNHIQEVMEPDGRVRYVSR
jgi:hypothetical protein